MQLFFRKIRKRAMAFLLAFVMCVGLLPTYSPLSVEATTATTTQGASSEIVNGDFESGRNGYNVRNWSETAMLQGHGKETDPDTAEGYCDNFTLTTAVEPDGNKVAALTKNGAGFVAATSEKTKVAGGQEYRLSFDYKTASLDFKNGATESNYYGIRLYVEEWSKDSEILVPVQRNDTHYYGDATNNPNWSTGMVQFQTNEKTDYVVIYLWVGGNMNVAPTVYFDNVSLEANDDYKVINGSFDDVTYLADGGRTAGTPGPAGWTMVGAGNAGKIKEANSSQGKYFTATTVDDVDGRKNVVLLQATGTPAHAMLQSSYIPVDGKKTCNIAADCKFDMQKADGTLVGAGNENPNKEIFINLACYDANKNLLDEVVSKQGKTTEGQWKKLQATAMSTVEETAYIKIGLHVIYATSDFSEFSDEDKESVKNFKLYYDNIVLDVENESLGYTKNTATSNCEPSSGAYASNYAIREVSTEIGYEDAIQLYVTREGGGMGGAAFWSKPLSVIAGNTYKIQFDWKVEGVEERSLGAAVALRYKNAQGDYISNTYDSPVRVLEKGISSNTVDSSGNTIWKTHSVDELVAPEGAVEVEMGFLIGVTTKDYNPDMKHSFANIAFAPVDDEDYWDKYDERAKDPAVTSSPLYKQSALFVGDMIGSGMAEKAVSYSEMQVTDACSETVSIEKQLSSNISKTFDYVVISHGDKEIKAQIPSGTVTPDTVYMNGVDFDSTTFAGMLEQIFAKVTEYQNPQKVVYVLPSDNATYKTVAQSATQKWGVELAILSDTNDAEKNWNDVIEPAERDSVFNCYDFVGLRNYLSEKVEQIAMTETSFENKEILENVLVKAENCPTEHGEYQAYITLAEQIEALIAEFDLYHPIICGATIAKNDANQMRFMAMSPKANLSSNIQVKKMGILVELPEETSVLDIETTYKGADILYDAILSGERVNPTEEYVAQAYVIYEENGREYIFYSENDYVNSVGEKTAEDGECVKSVYGIAQEIATKLSSDKSKVMDFSAIGGSKNMELIADATEETEVSLYDVYCLVSDNETVLKAWLSEGGASK